MVKQYLVSINNEVQDSFKTTLDSVKDRMVEEVFKTPLQSSYYHIKTIVHDSLSKFIDNVVTVLDYYTDGIYSGGKNIARKKLKLTIQKEKDKRYNFNHSDEMFLERFKYQQLEYFGDKLKKASLNYVTHKVANKIQDLWGILDDDAEKFNYTKQELVDDEMNQLVSIVTDTISSIYSEIIEAMTKEVILLYKCGQIEEYKSLGINHLRVKSSNDENSCPICKTRNLHVFKPSELMDLNSANDDMIHPFCKISIEPILNYKQYKHNNSRLSRAENYQSNYEHSFILNDEIKSEVEKSSHGDLHFYNVPIEIDDNISKMMQKIKMYLSDFINPLEFYFVNDIVETKEWFEKTKAEYLLDYDELKADTKTHYDQDNLRSRVVTFRTGQKVFISNFAIYTKPIEDIIIRELMRDLQADNFDWWHNRFDERINNVESTDSMTITKQPFVSFLAQMSPEDYLLESIVNYINNPNLLKVIDKEAYDQISSDIFNGINFK